MSPLIGEFRPPGDKSVSHRLILMSLLAKGEMLIKGLSLSEDVLSSLSAFRKLGGRYQEEKEGLRVWGSEGRLCADDGVTELDCGNSGTTMRLLSGILAGIPGFYRLDGDSQLRKRPMERVAEPLRLMGARVETQLGKPPLSITGGDLSSVDYKIQEASAQVKGAILLAGLSAPDGPTTVTELTETRSHTERLIAYFGGRVITEGKKITVYPGPLEIRDVFLTPADPSSAAFFLATAAIIPGSKVTAKGLLLSSARTGFLKVLNRMGASVTLVLNSDTPEPAGEVTVAYNGPLKGAEIPAEEVPSLIDEIPIMALVATRAEGTTIFRKVDELRIKETDRLMSIRHQLGALGARVKVERDDLIIQGPTSFILPESLDSGADHRLAMTLHMALLAAKAKIPILGDESIPISYPSFHEDLKRLAMP
jgi:3-phosphoshikimate 1-carboxyvinyltransferase